MMNNVLPRILSGWLLGDAIAPSISRRMRLTLALIAVPVGMAVGALLHRWGIW